MITHNVANQRFETVINGHTAYLSYEVIAENQLNYNHTIVPDALGGQGIGKALVKYALDDARAQGNKVRPSCSFVAHFIQKNPEYADLVI